MGGVRNAMRLISALSITFAALNVAACANAEEIPSGLAVGQHPQPLNVRDCTGPAAGKTLCYTCRYAERPTTAIFVRGLSPQVAQLIKRIDTEVSEKRDQRAAAYVVLVRDDEAELEAELKQLARELDLRHVPLTIFRDRRTKLASDYRIADRAALTVMHWRQGTVAASRGFSTTTLSPADIERVAADLATILH
jgi:hypothetical protein